MPYNSNSDLPSNVRNVLPQAAQAIWRKTFNSAIKQYGDETRARKVAWSQVKKTYKKVGDRWMRKEVRSMSKQKETMEELVERFEDVNVSITEQQDDGYRYATFLVSKGDYMNRNGRVYPTAIWTREADKIKSGKTNIVGQAGHPSLFAGTDPLSHFLLFTEGWVEESGEEDTKSRTHFFAKSRVVPTENGEKFATLVDAGVRFSVSTRGRGGVKQVDEWTGPDKVVHRDVAIVQDDYQLKGIDVLLQGDQSVVGANMIRFEATEEDNVELKEELEAMQDELTETKGRVEELEGEMKMKSEEISTLGETIVLKDAEITEKENQIITLTNQVNTIAEQRDKLKENQTKLLNRCKEDSLQDEARTHLLETVSGDPLAMLLVKELFDQPTAEAVDENIEAARVKVREELSGVQEGTPKGRISGRAGDGLEKIEEEMTPGQLRYLRMAGLA